MGYEMTRRELIECAMLAVSALSCVGAARAVAAPRTRPTMRIGRVEVSRLILGSNPFFGFSHQSREIDEEMRTYFTEERIVQLLDEAASYGITAVAAPPYPHWIALFRKYVQGGGKLRTWIAQPHAEPDLMPEEIKASIEGGAKAILIQGVRVDQQYEKDPKLTLVRKWVEMIKEHGLPAGMASHRPDVHLAAEKLGLPTDFYFQSFVQPGAYLAEDRDKAVAAIRQIRKPVVGFKILAAGRIPAKEGFAYAFRHLARKDGVCVGIYPKAKPDMLREDATLAATLSSTRA